MIKVAILVDGGYYRKRANSLFGEKTAKERAQELQEYCLKHLQQKHIETYLYRIFYYDCLPSEKTIYNPITKKSDALGKTSLFTWQNAFLKELKSKRKFAIRLGRLSELNLRYVIKHESMKSLLSGEISVSDLSEEDFSLNIQQKGMDMKLGTDIASMALKHQVDQMILIAGDSDFVPAAKLARREGIDFILDPMGNTITDDLSEHIDGIKSKIRYFTPKE